MSDNRLKGYTYSYQDSCIELYIKAILPVTYVARLIHFNGMYIASVTGWDPDR